MITVSNLSRQYGGKILFKDADLTFLPGNCYGLIGANGSGKSTFLKIIAGDVEASSGTVSIDKGKRMSVLQQDHYAFDEYTVLDTVIAGHKELSAMLKEKDAIEAKGDMSDEEGMRLGEIYAEMAEVGGYEAESDAGQLLDGLGIGTDMHYQLMSTLEGGEKVRVLLAQALFGNPDILLLDEPTNHLDLESIKWLENFLEGFENLVIVVSHDRHFLNQVCTHTTDIDFNQIKTYVGNYDFWAESSQMMQSQMRAEGKQREEKRKQLQAFISRFASNASKAKQATSRKKLLDKLDVDDMPASTRRFPFVEFKAERECGKNVLMIKDLTVTVDGEKLLDNFSLTVNRGDKIAFIGYNNNIKTALFDVLSGKIEPDSGSFEWGVTITHAYVPRENSEFFNTDLNLIDWLKQYSSDQSESFVRNYLGRMLFSSEESFKIANVLSGGEKVRMMLSRAMLTNANVLMLDEPTGHLDLEAITALNKGMEKYEEVMLFGSHDHEILSTVANRIVEFTPKGIIDQMMGFEEYLESETVREKRDAHYDGHKRLVL